MSDILKGFRDFVLRGNIVELAIAVVMGTAFGIVVKAFADDFIGGLIGVIGGSPNFGDAGFTVNHSKIVYGSTLTAAIYFVIVAAVIYFAVVLPLQRIGFGKKEGAPAGPTDVDLLVEIRDLLAEQNGGDGRVRTGTPDPGDVPPTGGRL